MKTRTRRGLSLILALMMIFSASGIMTVLAEAGDGGIDFDSEDQIVSGGPSGTDDPAQVSYYRADDTAATSSNYDVALKKTVLGTDTENVFDIELKVMTTQDLDDLEVSADAAVVLVMDVSNSMEWDISGNQYGVAEADKRITLAKTKAAAFVNSYVTDAGDAKRMISIVEFGSNAKTVSGWLNANSGSGVLSSDVTDAIDEVEVNFSYTYDDGYDGPGHPGGDNNTHTDIGGTNIEGGLMLARNLLTDGQESGGSIDGIKSVYVILLSDGEPTFHVNNNNQSTTETSFVLGEQGGGSYSTYSDYKDVPGIVSSIQSTATGGNAAKVLAVCFASSQEKMWWKLHENDSSTEILITDWLANRVGVSNVLSADTAVNLGTQLTQISQVITKLAQAWLVTDEMGGNILFADSNLIENGGDFSTNSNNTYYYDSSNRQLVWDVKNDLNGDTDDGVTTYTLTYRVILNTAAADFEAETAYPTNGDDDETDGSAQLKYLVLGEDDELDEMSPTDIDDAMHTANFTSPTVEGYLGSLTFEKTSAYNDQPLDNATFKLTGTLNGVSYTQMATSGEDGTHGLVEFENLPSGFAYTLTETAAPEDYVLLEDSSWKLVISGGDIHSSSTIDDEDTIENELDPKLDDITVTKEWRVPAGTILPSEIEVEILRGKEHYTDITMTPSDATDNPLIWTQDVTVPTINTETGEAYEYTAVEVDIDGYDSDAEGLTIVNTRTGVINSVKVTKAWILPDGWDVPYDATVMLTKGGDATEETLQFAATEFSDDSLQKSFTGLDMYNDLGQLITYGVTETPGTGFRLAGPIEGNVASGFTVTNTLTDEMTPVSGTKTWHVPDPDTFDYPDLELRLYAGDSVVASMTLDGDTTDYDENGTATYSFTEDDEEHSLPRYKFTYEGTGEDKRITAVEAIEYTVKEGYLNNEGVFVPVSGVGDDNTITLDGDTYKVIYDGDGGITNTITGTTDVKVTKVWEFADEDDESDDHGPAVMQLTQNGNDYGDKVEVLDDYIWEDLPMYDDNGDLYTYGISEEAITIPTGFMLKQNGITFTAEDGFTVTNKQDTTSLTGSKLWRQPTSIDNKPEVMVGLYADGIFTGKYTETTTTDGTQTYTFANIPQYRYEKTLVPGTGTEDEFDGEGNLIEEGVPAEYETEAVEIVYTVKEGKLDNDDKFEPFTTDEPVTIGSQKYFCQLSVG